MTSKTTAVKVTLTRSLIGKKQSHRDTVKGLGLSKINSSRNLTLTPEIAGMINKVSYLLRVE